MNPDDLDIVAGCIAVHPDQMGGQHVARQCTGVRITHRPTALTVMINTERSQHANREKAMLAMRELLATLDKAPI